MRGYFGLGVEGISKPMNAGSLFRTAHAFGAEFVFAIAPDVNMRMIRKADTSETDKHVPLYEYPTVEALQLPRGCQLVGLEFLDDAIDLPSFTHPAQAAYVLGSERGTLSPALLARCSHVVRIPTRFCVNVAVAAAILLYDRMITRRRFRAASHGIGRAGRGAAAARPWRPVHPAGLLTRREGEP